MGIYKTLLGTHETRFHIGGPLASFIKNVTSQLHLRNADDDAYVQARALHPTHDDALATRLYEESMDVLTSTQFDGGDAIPDNTGTREWVVVTESGVNANIGDLLFDDGTSSGSMLVFPAQPNREINAQASLTGSTQEFNTQTTYKWTGTAWIITGVNVAGNANALRMIRFSVAAVTVSSSNSLPAGAIVHDAAFQVLTGYTGGSTITVGTNTDADQFLKTTDLSPTAVAKYIADQESPNEVVGPSEAVKVTITGGGGTGVCTVVYAEPLN